MFHNRRLLRAVVRHPFVAGGGGGAALTWDPAHTGNVSTLANSNRDYTTATTDQGSRITAGKSTGKWYVEITTVSAMTSQRTGIGFGDTGYDVDSYPGASARSNMYSAFSETDGGNGAGNGIVVANTVGGLVNVGLSAGDIFGLAYDVDAGKVWLARNNTYYNSGAPASGTAPWMTWTPNGGTYFVLGYHGGGSSCILRLSATATYSAPSGFTLLNA